MQIVVNDTKAFGDYKCKAENSLGTLERIITLTEGVKPEKPSNLALRGVNSDTFDVDVGATRKTKERNPMDINGKLLIYLVFATMNCNQLITDFHSRLSFRNN